MRILILYPGDITGNGEYQEENLGLWDQYSFFSYTKPSLSIKDSVPKHFYLFIKFLKNLVQKFTKIKWLAIKALLVAHWFPESHSHVSACSAPRRCVLHPTQSLPYSFLIKSSTLQERQDNTLPRTWINDLTKWNRPFWKLTWVQAVPSSGWELVMEY